MFNSRTLFVVGAGASEELGLPLGSGLARDISAYVDFKDGGGDNKLRDYLTQKYADNIHTMIRAAEVVVDGVMLSSSVDDFLAKHEGDETVKTCIKAAIVRSILEGERRSIEHFGLRIRDSKLASTWYVRFMKLLSTDIGKPNADKKQSNTSCLTQYNNNMA
jgi:hypothetical protein